MGGSPSDNKKYRLVTANSSPDKAYTAAARLTTELKGTVDIQHIGNINSISETRTRIEQLEPDFLICAPVWTAEESNQIKKAARDGKPDLKIHVIPPELAPRGPEAIMEHLVEAIPPLLSAQWASVF